MNKIVIYKTKIEDGIYPLLYLLDEHNHPVEIINILYAGRAHVPHTCTVKKVLPKIKACLGQLEDGQMCYLPFERIKQDSFIIKHSDKKVVCEEDQLTVYIFKPQKDGKYCLVNCDEKKESFVFNEDISDIICESEEEAALIKESLSAILNPDINVRVYSDDTYPMSDMYGLNRALAEQQKSRIYLKSGGNICIDKTTAATFIDVNSGDSSGSRDALRINIEAATEISRQIRLKNISGQIVVDFINMKNEKDQETVEKTIIDTAKNDRAKIRVFGFTAMGLFEMTRSSGITGI